MKVSACSGRECLGTVRIFVHIKAITDDVVQIDGLTIKHTITQSVIRNLNSQSKLIRPYSKLSRTEQTIMNREIQDTLRDID